MTRTYHVCGMGAALVDTEIEVTDKDLETLAIDKGRMTLVDESRQAQLLDYLSHHLTASRRASGGSAANTIIAVSAFGGSSFFCGKVADDDNGAFYLQDMNEAGVTTPAGASLPQGTTGKCLVLITPDAERTMNTYLGISETLCVDDLDLDAVANAEYLYIEGYLATSETGHRAAVAARQHARQVGTRVALSLSDPGIVTYFRDPLKTILDGKVDLLFCNREEALVWTDTHDIQAAAEELGKWAEYFVITMGSEGALIHDGNELCHVPARPITAVDTNGAGDMFAGAFLYGITHGMDFRAAGELACTAAATVVGQFGPRLPLAQYRGLLESYNGKN